MRKEIRTVVYDEELRMEAYRFEGIVQPFPSHFHEHYVIGVVESGERALSCRGREYAIGEGSILLFHPGDSHACVQSDGGMLDYRGINIAKETMLDLAEEITGKRELPGFSENVIEDEEAACHLRSLHEMVMTGRAVLSAGEYCPYLHACIQCRCDYIGCAVLHGGAVTTFFENGRTAAGKFLYRFCGGNGRGRFN